MNVEELKARYAKLPGKLVQGRKDSFFRIEENKPVTFFILAGGGEAFPDIKPEGYTTPGVWVRPIGTHFIGKRISCTNISNPGSCYICEKIREWEEELSALKIQTEETMKKDSVKGEALLVQVGDWEKTIQQIRSQEKFAMNILVKGTDLPVIFEAPKSVAEPIYQMFDTSLQDDGINILEPLTATSFTVTKVGKGLTTKYTVTSSPRPLPIMSGHDKEERIKKALLAGVNLDEQYKLPMRSEQITAWENYLNPQAATQTAQKAPVAPPAALSRVGRPTPTATPPPPAPVAEDSEPSEDGDEETEAPELQEKVQQTVAQIAQVSGTGVNSLLKRLKEAGAAR